VSQEKSKMPVSRQIGYFRGSRDNWKRNAAKKKRKIREYEQTICSLKISRDNWKTRAKEAEKRVKKLENKLEKQEAKNSKISQGKRISKAIDS
jgi:septal ring factor EnvC (AmiA/AmiB activator)